MARVTVNDKYPVEAWQREVARGATWLGYSDWAELQSRRAEPARCPTCGHPLRLVVIQFRSVPLVRSEAGWEAEWGEDDFLGGIEGTRPGAVYACTAEPHTSTPSCGSVWTGDVNARLWTADRDPQDLVLLSPTFDLAPVARYYADKLND